MAKLPAEDAIGLMYRPGAEPCPAGGAFAAGGSMEEKRKGTSGGAAIPRKTPLAEGREDVNGRHRDFMKKLLPRRGGVRSCHECKRKQRKNASREGRRSVIGKDHSLPEVLTPTVFFSTNRVAIVSATATGRQMKMFLIKPARMKDTKLIPATVIA